MLSSNMMTVVVPFLLSSLQIVLRLILYKIQHFYALQFWNATRYLLLMLTLAQTEFVSWGASL